VDVLSPPAGLSAGRRALIGPEIAGYLVGAAVWAPSVHNTQPWWFRADGREISLYADTSRQLVVADPAGREMMISCGAALFTVRLALRALGYIPRAHVLPDPAEPLLIARVSWQQRAAQADYELRLFDQVLQRRTHRGGFDPLPLPPGLLSVLQAGAERDGAALRIITGEASRALLATTTEMAERTQRLDGPHAREMAAWVPPPGSGRDDGLPPTAYPARQVRTVPHFPGRDFAHGRGWGMPASTAQAAARSAGAVCLLTTAADRPADWVSAGQALQRILLTSAASGVAAALHSQPLELRSTRQFIRTQLSDGSYPQLVIRLGTVIQTARSIRRPPASILFTGGSGRSRPGY